MTLCNYSNKTLKHLLLILLGGMAAGAVFQWILPVGGYWQGAGAAALLIFLCSAVLYAGWRGAGDGKALAWMMLAAFLLRIALGVFLAWGLPKFGYQEPPQQAGFVFEDAFRRDENAWALANSQMPLTEAFSDTYETDQYGGMLFLSATVYRYISPDAYRPALISILSAGAFALSIPFLFSVLRRRFDRKTALWGGWIFSLYPESILLGAAQMREPFFILFFSAMFWAVDGWLANRWTVRKLVIFLVSAVLLFLFSFRVAIPIVGVLLFWAWVNLLPRVKQNWIRIAGWVILGLGMVGVLYFFWYWVDAVLHWDTLQTIKRSGMVQFQIERLPQWMHFPFILIYGIFQPVLPAAIAAPAPWIWKSLGIFRAVGWYAIFPVLFYGLIRVWSVKDKDHKRWLSVIVAIAVIWVFVASARAGGDQWDNPRYRTIFLPWIALSAAWAVRYAIQTKDRWLKRILIVEGVFLVFTTYWYLSRYLPQLPGLDLLVMAGVIFVLSIVIIVGGWIWDRQKVRQMLE